MSATWANSTVKQRIRARLYTWQGGICAGCGVPFGEKVRSERSPLAKSLDHVEPRARGGSNRIWNLLLKHRRCNELRGDDPPTGCDLVWKCVIVAKMGDARPWVRPGPGLPAGPPEGRRAPASVEHPAPLLGP